MVEKRVRLTVDFRMKFREITEDVLVEVNAPLDAEEVLRNPANVADVARQARLLRAVLADEEALLGFIASAVIDELWCDRGHVLREELGVEGNEGVLWPVIERLGGEVAEFFEGARERGVFDEYTDLLIYSTPIECLGARLEEVGEGGGAEESDNLR